MADHFTKQDPLRCDGYLLLHIGKTADDVFAIGPYQSPVDALTNGPGRCGVPGHRMVLVPLIFDVASMVQDIADNIGAVIDRLTGDEAQEAQDRLN